MFGPVPKGPSEGGEVLVNNNKNKFPALSGYMSNTVHKTGERSFKEERRDVMTMNKFFTGLIALVAGVALSAGSAFATKGYTIGDPAAMKLVPFYETGGSLFTAIGIQNLAGQATVTQEQHEAVETADTALMTAKDADSPDLDDIDDAEKALADAKAAVKTEHMVVNVKAYDAMGMMMAEVSLCLAENQFGYVVLTGDGHAASIENRGMVLSMADDMIDMYGYVTVMGGSKYTGCSFGAMSIEAAGGTSDIATWTIIQDVGTGFFGTEIPSSTITMGTDNDDTENVDESTMLACYGDDTVGGTTGEFNEAIADVPPTRCGLIPERHDNSRTDGDLENPATPPSHVTVRFDVVEGSYNDVMVWLAAGGDTMDTLKVDRRMLSVTTRCEDGTMAMIPDPSPTVEDGTMMSTAMVPASGMVTIIDPMSEMLMPYTSQCMAGGGRGVLQFMMPNKSVAGMAWTHISQRMSNFRMNMPGYNMGSDTVLTSTELTAANE
jgi:hypothetical protein